ncbi:hypothetical protein EDB81DRAFT_765990 [Dactylonectria macrodidyma]|uniref:Uncharacterized protein n=1 Tax=Dactylonectria macrodidyma TaxID=307937 RepID=A0A9P9IKZ5_9HYPO|nr:hypothetical protein EDB81DRAFT_765990 [Dactylonectria macrodidyma]
MHLRSLSHLSGMWQVLLRLDMSFYLSPVNVIMSAVGLTSLVVGIGEPLMQEEIEIQTPLINFRDVFPHMTIMDILFPTLVDMGMLEKVECCLPSLGVQQNQPRSDSTLQHGGH